MVVVFQVRPALASWADVKIPQIIVPAFPVGALHMILHKNWFRVLAYNVFLGF